MLRRSAQRVRWSSDRGAESEAPEWCQADTGTSGREPGGSEGRKRQGGRWWVRAHEQRSRREHAEDPRHRSARRPEHARSRADVELRGFTRPGASTMEASQAREGNGLPGAHCASWQVRTPAANDPLGARLVVTSVTTGETPRGEHQAMSLEARRRRYPVGSAGARVTSAQVGGSGRSGRHRVGLTTGSIGPRR